MKYEYAPERHHGVSQLMAVGDDGIPQPLYRQVKPCHVGVGAFVASKLLGVKTTRAAIYGAVGYLAMRFLAPASASAPPVQYTAAKQAVRFWD